MAQEISAGAVLIDEIAGRRVARQLGLTVVGALGVLVLAKGAGRVHRVAPLIDRFEREIGFRVSRQVRARILADAGESGDE